MFNGARLRLARCRAGLTKSELADAAGVSRVMIHQYEADQAEPSEGTAASLVRVLSYPKDFFFGGRIDEPNIETASFRSMSHMMAADRDAALAAGSIAFLLDDWVEKEFERPTPALFDLSTTSPESSARTLRELWGLGEKPIKNLVHLLEAKGIRVFSLVEKTRSVDAFSMWRNDRPYIFLNTIKTSEHSRFDAAHELAHLVLHRHGGPQGRTAEDEANQFAAAFLMPDADVRATLPRVYGVNQIIAKKARWRVSAFALAHRLNKLKLVTEWQYRQFCIHLSQQGYRTAEPGGIERERSTVWEKVFSGLRKDRITKHDIARAIHVPVSEIDKLVFGLATMISIEGGGRSGLPSARLQLVARN